MCFISIIFMLIAIASCSTQQSVHSKSDETKLSFEESKCFEQTIPTDLGAPVPDILIKTKTNKAWVLREVLIFQKIVIPNVGTATVGYKIDGTGNQFAKKINPNITTICRISDRAFKTNYSTATKISAYDGIALELVNGVIENSIDSTIRHQAYYGSSDVSFSNEISQGKAKGFIWKIYKKDEKSLNLSFKSDFVLPEVKGTMTVVSFYSFAE